ncbi:MAG: LacI family DNA-binding transcriptional regulator [Rubellimicrobium sp.]|nr:LacI family DNA-binding transcriptional regulator [Rubellimicrobium sp.]
MKDVAAVAGVSIKTVSRVVNDEASVAEDTRRLVQDTIEQLKFRPNQLARGLVKLRSGSIGLVVTNMSNMFFSEMTQEVMLAARALGNHVVVVSHMGNAEEQAEIVASLISQGVDAIMIYPAVGGDARLLDVAQGFGPLVLMDHILPETDQHENLFLLQSDISGGIGQVVHHLCDRGHEHIAIEVSAHVPEARRWRERGFVAAMAARGLATHRRIVSDATSVRETDCGSRAVEILRETFPETTALICYNDMRAMGAIAAARAAGLRVPQDLAVVGFDDLAIGELIDPPLTTVALNKAQTAAAAVQLAVVGATEGHGTVRDPWIVPVQLIVRKST